MRAISLRACLNSLGANLNYEIRYIETYDSNEDYLDKVCKAVDESLIYDKDRTESQPDICSPPTVRIQIHALNIHLSALKDGSVTIASIIATMTIMKVFTAKVCIMFIKRATNTSNINTP